MNANQEININEHGQWWSGNGFFSLQRTRRWYLGLTVAVLGSIGMISFIIGAYYYDLAMMHTDACLKWAIPLASFGILIYFSVMSWASFNLSQALQNFRNYSSPLLRANAIYTAFVGLFYTMLSLMQYDQPLVFLDNLAPTTWLYMSPLALLLLIKVYIAVYLKWRFNLNLSKSMLAFWTMLIITATIMFYNGTTHPDYDRLFDPVTMTVVCLTGVAGCNMLFSYSAATIKVSTKQPL